MNTCKGKSEAWKRIFIVLLAAFGAVVFVSFITTPLAGDIKVFIAAENQVKFKDTNGLRAVFEAWELKGIANRLFMYLLYRAAEKFVTYGDIVQFEIAVKFIYGIVMVIVMTATALMISDERIRRAEVFFMEFVAVFATYTASQMQTEMTAVVLSFFVSACLIREKRWSSIIAGITGAFLLFFKSILIVLFLAAVLGAVLYKGVENTEKKNIICAVSVMAVSEILLAGFVGIYYPQEFRDMSLASELQATLFSAGSAVSLDSIWNHFTNWFTQSVVAIPFLLIGVASTEILVIGYLKRREWMEMALLLSMWILVIDIIVVSNKYFIYHYFLLVLPGLISVLIVTKKEKVHGLAVSAGGFSAFLFTLVCWGMKDGYKQTGIINYSTVLLVIIHVLFLFSFYSEGLKYLKNISIYVLLTVCAFFWMNYSSLISPKYRSLKNLSSTSEQICKAAAIPADFSKEPVLFLDDGTAPFYMDAPSYSRYFFNLPMQRWSEGDAWDIQKKEYERLMQYDGKYIVYSGWFGIDKYPQLKDKIDTEYERLENSGLFLYSPDWNVFSLSGPPDAKSVHSGSGTCILVRKPDKK